LQVRFFTNSEAAVDSPLAGGGATMVDEDEASAGGNCGCLSIKRLVKFFNCHASLAQNASQCAGR